MDIAESLAIKTSRRCLRAGDDSVVNSCAFCVLVSWKTVENIRAVCFGIRSPDVSGSRIRVDCVVAWDAMRVVGMEQESRGVFRDTVKVAARATRNASRYALGEGMVRHLTHVLRSRAESVLRYSRFECAASEGNGVADRMNSRSTGRSKGARRYCIGSRIEFAWIT